MKRSRRIMGLHSGSPSLNAAPTCRGRGLVSSFKASPARGRGPAADAENSDVTRTAGRNRVSGSNEASRRWRSVHVDWSDEIGDDKWTNPPMPTRRLMDTATNRIEPGRPPDREIPQPHCRIAGRTVGTLTRVRILTAVKVRFSYRR